MDRQLLQDTIIALQQEIDPDTAIDLDIDERLMDEMVALIHSYRMAKARKRTILGVYMLIQLAVARHREMVVDDNASRTRNILDGDYLLGLYYRWVVKYGEMTLLTFLAPIHKKLQLQLAGGRPCEAVLADLKDHLRRFMDEHSAKGGDSDEAA